ncbi:hypothetical protein [Hymenobacter sp. CRA2]|uniref:hypothetical protein n=1 Tax=Hymenobacter sp. CRA2 TaxID=1955620 RepID=UPI0009900697|nr:hypothetical protein [Hymenobacter sp. CRA2]OON65286.1 hypothetical protein B0919_24285 [Hymenobacter sp. CRA2]
METTLAVRKPRKAPLLPANDQQLATMAEFVARHWQTETWLTLRHCTAARFLQLTETYTLAVASRQQAGSARPIDADELLNLDALIEANLYRVKNRLTDKYNKKAAPAHYPTMGIIKYDGTYILDRDRSRRAAALKTLVQGLTTENIADGDYGLAFWQPIAERYPQLLQQITAASGAVSAAVSQKDTMRAEVETVLSSLAKVLDGNYPDKQEYKAQLRAWGFQK